jgi:hypothetical protein
MESVWNARLEAFVLLSGMVLLSLPAFAQQRTAPIANEPNAAPQTDAPHATMTCEPVPVPGRVRCEVEARVSPGQSISWGDVVLQRVPPFATALRGRVGPHDASVREPDLWRWPFALVARAKGTGQVEGQVRVVVCRDKSCAAQDVPVVGQVAVGP